VILRERKKIMRSVIISTLAAITTLATVSIVVAENEQRISPTRTDAVPATNAPVKDAATGNVPGLITPEQHKTIPYRACINARGWVNGRLVCTD
jgi:hypothetical protein